MERDEATAVLVQRPDLHHRCILGSAAALGGSLQ